MTLFIIIYPRWTTNTKIYKKVNGILESQKLFFFSISEDESNDRGELIYDYPTPPKISLNK